MQLNGLTIDTWADRLVNPLSASALALMSKIVWH